jgi:hypothetical protein
MPKRLRSIKVDDADYDTWRQKAAEAGVSTSEWIRERCNEDKWVSDKESSK